jgi:hypothetical protein
MLPVGSDEQTLAEKVRSTPRLAAMVVHYAIVSFAITFGVLATARMVLATLGGDPRLGDGWATWTVFGGISLSELFYRPSFKTVSASGTAALLLFSAWFAILLLITVALSSV